MQIRPAELAAIRAGTIDLAFRRWDRPRLLVGTRMRTKVGLIEILEVSEVAESSLTELDARRAGAADLAALLTLLVGVPERPIHRVRLQWAGADPRVALRADGELTAEVICDLTARLERFDAASRHGPWTHRALDLIAANPARRAPDLAVEAGLETIVFKRNIRKLKELGLTESLEVGYRLSSRGRTLLDRLP